MDTPRLALSVRQPWAELILRGDKTREYRPRATRVVGERFWLYAAQTPGEAAAWAEAGCEAGELPTGVIVGTAVIGGCKRVGHALGEWAWELADVRRLAVPVRPERHPQPTWWRPFDVQSPPSITRLQRLGVASQAAA